MRAHEAVWPSRLPDKISPPVTSLWMNLAISAMRYPSKPALVYMGKDPAHRRWHHDKMKNCVVPPRSWQPLCAVWACKRVSA
jgi:hypothetical protein